MLRDIVEEYVRGLGFHEVEEDRDFWTHPKWKDWWERQDGSTYDRQVLFDQLVGSVMYDEKTDGYAPS